MIEPTEKLKKVRGKNGGARPGAGRKPGGMNYKTVERLAIKQEFIDRIHEVATELFEAQYKLAMSGDRQAVADLLDRGFGRAGQSLDLTTAGKELPAPILGGMSKTETDG